MTLLIVLPVLVLWLAIREFMDLASPDRPLTTEEAYEIWPFRHRGDERY